MARIDQKSAENPGRFSVVQGKKQKHFHYNVQMQNTLHSLCP